MIGLPGKWLYKNIIFSIFEQLSVDLKYDKKLDKQYRTWYLNNIIYNSIPYLLFTACSYCYKNTIIVAQTENLIQTYGAELKHAV